MTRELAAADDRLSVDAVEVEREGLSFTVDTVRGYRAARPDAELYLLMGEDTAATLGVWREAGAGTSGESSVGAGASGSPSVGAWA
jgi:nicotinate-nucleotide adenylyltransferase